MPGIPLGFDNITALDACASYAAPLLMQLEEALQATTSQGFGHAVPSTCTSYKHAATQPGAYSTSAQPEYRVISGLLHQHRGLQG